MKIAITADPFIPVPPVNYGGIERIIFFLVEGLKARGHDVLLVANKESRVSSKHIPYSNRQKGVFAHLRNISTINKIRSFNPDLIHSFSRLAYLLPFYSSNIPKLMSYQREPTISQVQKAVSFCKKDTLFFSGCSNYITNKITPFAPAFTVYNGINLDIYNCTSVVENDAPLIFLGRIEPIKGTHIAIEIAKATGKRLLIAGNIPSEYNGYFDSKIRPFLNERIEYIGPVNDEQKNDLLGKSLAFLMPIEWEEPFGIVMAEALACGTPVIGYNRGAVPEVVEPGRNGFIAKDFPDFCDLVGRVHELDRVQVRKSAEARFDSNVIIEDYINLYKQLIRN